MTETIDKLEHLLKRGLEYLNQSSELELRRKESDEKWSKKEILGHLIDSGINNLQRFTEVQFENKPYRIRNYNQNELVKANDYQNSNTNEIAQLWKAVNNQILNILQKQTEETLSYEIELERENYTDLRFLIKDYVEHLEHHLKQILT